MNSIEIKITYPSAHPKECSEITNSLIEELIKIVNFDSQIQSPQRPPRKNYYSVNMISHTSKYQNCRHNRNKRSHKQRAPRRRYNVYNETNNSNSLSPICSPTAPLYSQTSPQYSPVTPLYQPISPPYTPVTPDNEQTLSKMEKDEIPYFIN